MLIIHRNDLLRACPCASHRRATQKRLAARCDEQTAPALRDALRTSIFRKGLPTDGTELPFLMEAETSACRRFGGSSQTNKTLRRLGSNA